MIFVKKTAYDLARQDFSSALSSYRHSHTNLQNDQFQFNSRILRTLEREHQQGNLPENASPAYASLYSRYINLVNAGINSLVPNLRQIDLAGLAIKKGQFIFRGTLLRRAILIPRDTKKNEYEVSLLSASRRREDYVDFTPSQTPEIAAKYALKKLTLNDPIDCKDRKDAVLLALNMTSRVINQSKTSDECQNTIIVPAKELVGQRVKVFRPADL